MCDSNPAISVIVPVYNEEKFLRNCLNSIAGQTMRDFEVIVVNDGSTDNSLNIMKEFKDKYTNFIIINKENSGTSGARNQALKYARGDYIAFVDSDDYIEPEFLKRLYSFAKKTDSDIACCGYYTYIPEKNKHIRKPFCLKTGVYSSEKILNSLIKDVRMHFYMWNKLWKRKLFEDHNITFPDMCFEDIPVSMNLFYFADKIAVINEEYYNYTRHENSIVSNMDVQKLNDYIKAFACIRNFLEKNNDFDNYKFSFLWYGYRTIITNFKLVYKVCTRNKDFKGLIPKLISLNSNVLNCMKSDFTCFNSTDDFPDSIR